MAAFKFSLLLLLALSVGTVLSVAIYPSVTAPHLNSTTRAMPRLKSRIAMNYHNCDHEQQVRIVEAVTATGQMVSCAVNMGPRPRIPQGECN